MKTNSNELPRADWSIPEIACVSVVSAMFFVLLGFFMLAKVQQYKFRRLPVRPTPEAKEYTFHHLSYKMKQTLILNQLHGTFPPGTISAIMGPSGAGKSTLLDILAHKSKKGKVSAQFALDGCSFTYPSRKFQHMIGFVDQEDILIPWLTVEECLWFVANTRLPESMSKKEKETIIHSVLTDLNIMHIRQTRIGGSGTSFRGISGGERRRVSVAMELITSPCILFLDEPTSGLDSFHAYKLVQTLTQLAHVQRKTIVCTIHQPRQDTYSLFDRIILMSQGQILFQGESHLSEAFFESHGLACPFDYHIADHMIDLAMRPDILDLIDSKPPPSPLLSSSSTPSSTVAVDEDSISVNPQRHSVYYVNLDPTRTTNDTGKPSKRIYQVSFLTQLNCLLSRNLKCLIRNHRLLFGHNFMAIVWGLFLGAVFYRSDLDREGLQNRLGLFLFVQLLIAFTSFSALSGVACDRLLFMRERGNTYYRPAAYFVSKVTMDVLPLRILPTFFTGTIVYFMAGLQLSFMKFTKCISILLLFNIGTCAFCMGAGALFADIGLGNFLASIVMLFSMIFNGLQLSLNLLPVPLSWFQYLSFFRWASEALYVNELTGLKFQINILGDKKTFSGEYLLTSYFKLDLSAYTLNLCILAILDMTLLLVVGSFVVCRLREVR